MTCAGRMETKDADHEVFAGILDQISFDV